jgi:signal transduction histidine kinase/Tfp pilus assembly protein PilF
LDSLLDLLNNSSANFDLLFAVSYEYVGSDNQKALEYVNEAYRVARNNRDSLQIVKACRIKSSALRRLDRLDEAILVAQEGLAIARRNNYETEVKLFLNSLAIAYTFKAEFDKALDLHFQSLLLREKEGNKSEISITLNNIGLVYLKLANFKSAIEYFDRSIKLKKEINDTYDLDRALINLGLCYNQIGKFDESIKAIQEGLQICNNQCDEAVQIEGLFSLGSSYFNSGNIEDGRNFFQQSLNMSKSSNNKRFQAENLLFLSKIATIEGEFDSGFKLLADAEQIAESAGLNQLLLDIYQQFAQILSKKDDYKTASRYQGKYISLKDSIYGAELIDNISRVETKFAERENIATIAAKEEALRKQRNLNLAIAAIAVLSALLVFFLYRLNKISKKARQLLDEQNKDLDKQVKARTMELEVANKSLEKAKDELDNFIYKTSHDIRGPLASLRGMCGVALMDVKDELALTYLHKLDMTAGKLNTILTRMVVVNQINNSTPGSEVIDFKHIVDEIIQYEKKKGLPKPIDIQKEIMPDIQFFSDAELVRIILENLIDNAIKFHNDSERVKSFVKVIIQDQNHAIVMKVIDNGIGIAQPDTSKLFKMFSRGSERSQTGGIGLYLSKLAAEKLGGRIEIHTTHEGYTEFEVIFPVYSQVAVV